MGDYQNFGENNKTNKVKESLDIKKEENVSARANEDYVFKFEENSNSIKTGENYTGGEYNNVSHIKKSEQKEFDTKEFETATSTTTSTAAATTTSTSVASAVQTVAVATTTAVVVVVGGGLVVYGQTVEKPAIVQFESLYAFENTIHFSLALGNDREKIYSGEDNGECDIVIELTCESYSDFHQTKEVKNYGVLEHEFSDLYYSTEYTISIFQLSFLDLERELLIEPIKITTEDEEIPEPEPEPTGGSFTFDKVTGPFGRVSFYFSTSYDGDTTNLSNFTIRYSDEDISDDGQAAWLGEIAYRELPTTRQEINLDIADAEGTYYFALFALDNTPSGRYDPRPYNIAAESSLTMLFKQEVDFSKIDSQVSNENIIAVHRTVGLDGAPNTYQIYADIVNKSDYYSDFIIDVYSVEGEMCFTIPLKQGLQVEQYFDFPSDFQYSENDTFAFVLTCINTNPDDIAKYNEDNPGSEVSDAIYGYELYRQTIDLSTIEEPYTEPDIPEDPDYEFKSFEIAFKESYYGYQFVRVSEFEYEDPSECLSNFTVTFTQQDGFNTITSAVGEENFGGLALVDLEPVDIDTLREGIWNVEIYADVMDRNQASTTGTVENVKIYETVIDSEDIYTYPIAGSLRFEQVSRATTSGNDLYFYVQSSEDMDLSNYSGGQVKFIPQQGEPIIESITSFTEGNKCENFIDDNQVWSVTTSIYGSTEGGLIDLFTETIDFSTIDGNEPVEEDPRVDNIDFVFKSSHYETRFIFVDNFEYTDTNGYWSEFEVTFTATDDQDLTFTSGIVSFDYGGNYLPEIDDFKMMYGHTYDFTVTADSTDPESSGNVIIYTSSANEAIDLEGLEPVDLPTGALLFDGSVEFISNDGATADDPKVLSMNIDFVDSTLYSNVTVTLSGQDPQTGDELSYTETVGTTFQGYVMQEFVNYHLQDTFVTVSGIKRGGSGEEEEIFSETVDFTYIDGNEYVEETPTGPTIDGSIGFDVYSSYQNSSDEYLVVDFQLVDDGESWDITLLEFTFTSGSTSFTGTVHALTNGSGKKYLEFESSTYITNLQRTSYNYAITYDGVQIDNVTRTTNPNDISNEIFNGSVQFTQMTEQLDTQTFTIYMMTLYMDNVEIYDSYIVTFEYMSPTGGNIETITVRITAEDMDAGVEVTSYGFDFSGNTAYTISVNGYIGNEPAGEFIFSESVSGLTYIYG